MRAPLSQYRELITFTITIFHVVAIIFELPPFVTHQCRVKDKDTAQKQEAIW